MSGSEQRSPSYEELAALVVSLASQLERAQARIAELEARLGRDSTNSSTPPSQDSIAAKANRSSRERSKDRKPGGQPGYLPQKVPLSTRGLKQLRCARVISAGHAFIQNIRRGHYELGVEKPMTLRVATAFTELGPGDLTNRDQRPRLPRRRTTQLLCPAPIAMGVLAMVCV